MSNDIFAPSSGEGVSPNEGAQEKVFITPELEKKCRELVKDLLAPKASFSPELWANAFNDFTQDNKRIYYSVISVQIYELSLNNEEIADYFNENLARAYKHIPEKNEKILLKLYDHINLCIQQVNLFTKVDNITKTDFQIKLNRDFDEAKKKIQKQDESIEEIEKKSKNVQREYVAVLGIFTAVILSFVSGSMFLNSSLNNIHQVSFWRVSFTTITVGMILINILIALFMFIKRILREDEVYPKYAVTLNAIMFAILLVVAGCWQNNVGNLNNTVQTHKKETKPTP